MPSFFLCFRELKISFADLKFNDLTVCSGAMLCAECNVLRRFKRKISCPYNRLYYWSFNERRPYLFYEKVQKLITCIILQTINNQYVVCKINQYLLTMVGKSGRRCFKVGNFV